MVTRGVGVARGRRTTCGRRVQGNTNPGARPVRPPGGEPPAVPVAAVPQYRGHRWRRAALLPPHAHRERQQNATCNHLRCGRRLRYRDGWRSAKAWPPPMLASKDSTARWAGSYLTRSFGVLSYRKPPTSAARNEGRNARARLGPIPRPRSSLGPWPQATSNAVHRTALSEPLGGSHPPLASKRKRHPEGCRSCLVVEFNRKPNPHISSLSAPVGSLETFARFRGRISRSRACP